MQNRFFTPMRIDRKILLNMSLAIILTIPSLLIAQDTTALINANRITMFAGNDGILANDFFQEIGDDFAGFYYTADITQYVIWSSALWIVGKVDENIRTGMAY
ncbi:MAG: hypothetical protein GWN00_00500, partial [Aliifodinibius sp.]|nr:hypothetical protein [candidate division Zixibacteria bacterium]NIT54760.1 hypothetical protein [Fodinibius sp.]NIW39168.1 hypothetical protein [candidate division Zixibacteria bacterium]NIX54429.1 hypothetical protein [candidate division Zixibacteria bacterium]NIY23344.1 hypothetical protein [Fodinibius sp.]